MDTNYEIKEGKLETTTSHPSYGALVFNRTYGDKKALFGSSIEHENVITMDLYHADVTRDLSRDSIHRKGLITSVEMSYSQFAEAITSLGMGSRVPVTIKYTEKDGRTPSCDFVSKTKQFLEEFTGKREKAMQESQDLIQEVSDLFSQKKTLTKADKITVLEKLERLNMDIGCNMDFVAKQFNTQMEKTITEAKGEIEAFCQNKIQSIANEALAERRTEFLALDNPVSIEENV